MTLEERSAYFNNVENFGISSDELGDHAHALIKALEQALEEQREQFLGATELLAEGKASYVDAVTRIATLEREKAELRSSVAISAYERLEAENDALRAQLREQGPP